MNKEDSTIMGCIGITASIPALIIVGTCMSGWALSVLWGWFIVPVFDLPSLTIIQAIGISTIISFVMPTPSVETKEGKSFTEVLIEAFLKVIFLPPISVFFGWIITLFM